MGAAPQIGYSLLMELLAEGGYTVVTTPFKLSFKHLDVANGVYQVGRGGVGCGTVVCHSPLNLSKILWVWVGVRVRVVGVTGAVGEMMVL